jgi:hypothetical protein
VRKRHNQTKRLITQSVIALKGLALRMRLSQHEKGIDTLNLKTGKHEPITQSVAAALDRTALKWGVLLAVHALESNGKEKTVVEWHRLAAAYRHSDLTDWLRVNHQAMIDNCKAQVVDASWIALPVPPQFVDDAAETALVDSLTGLIENNLK